MGAHNSTYTVCLVRRPSGLSWNDENWAWRLPKEFFSHRSQQQPLETAMAARSNHQQINIVFGYQMQETAGDITFAQQRFRFQSGCSTLPSLKLCQLGPGLQPGPVPGFA
jgi:hypothetical protein